MCSTIRPTYRLSYDNVVELLQMNVEEEADLYLLDEIAQVRREWRMAQVSYLLKDSRSVVSEVLVNDMYEVVSCYFCPRDWGGHKLHGARVYLSNTRISLGEGSYCVVPRKF